MTHSELAKALRSGVGGASVILVSEGGNFPFLEIDPEAMGRALRYCALDASICADFLEDIIGADVEGRLSVTYRLCSTEHRHRFHLRAFIDLNAAQLPSVAGVWPAARNFEREIAEMLGIRFEGHPEPEPLLLPEGWRGFPLRKDYDFPEEFGGIMHRRD